jgi:molybdopterin-guanine dinucleotide biosynthesis protein A
MGASKVTLTVEGRTLVTVLAERLLDCVSDVFVVLKESQRDEVPGLRCIFDSSPRRAVVHGVRAALEAPGPTWRLVLACDMPGMDVDLLRVLWGAARAAAKPGACVQIAGNERPEPFPSLWHRDVALAIREDWGMTAGDWLRRAGLAVSPLPPETTARLANVNTPDEWSDWRRSRSGGVRD